MDVQELGLAAGDLVLVDSGPLIYYVESGPESPRGACLAALLGLAEEGELGLLGSTLLWTEVLAGLGGEAGGTRSGSLDLAYRSLLADSRRIRLIPVEVSVADRAAALLRSHPRLGLGDGLHLATALVAGAAAILSNDEAWRPLLEDEGRHGPVPRLLLVDELRFSLGD